MSYPLAVEYVIIGSQTKLLNYQALVERAERESANPLLVAERMRKDRARHLDQLRALTEAFDTLIKAAQANGACGETLTQASNRMKEAQFWLQRSYGVAMAEVPR